MSAGLESVQPLPGAARSLRRRLGLRGELVLALLPTATVLVMLVLVEALSRQRLLFGSLASSAFLIYLDPQHGTNTTRTLLLSQMVAAVLGWLTFRILGPGYGSAGSAMLLTILLMIVLDAMHPPAVGTSLSFAFRAGQESDLLLFGLAALITTLLVGLERYALWAVGRYTARDRGA